MPEHLNICVKPWTNFCPPAENRNTLPSQSGLCLEASHGAPVHPLQRQCDHYILCSLRRVPVAQASTSVSLSLSFLFWCWNQTLEKKKKTDALRFVINSTMCITVFCLCFFLFVNSFLLLKHRAVWSYFLWTLLAPRCHLVEWLLSSYQNPMPCLG